MCEDPWLMHRDGNLPVPKADSISTFVDENLRSKKVRTPQGVVLIDFLYKHISLIIQVTICFVGMKLMNTQKESNLELT